MHLGNTVNFTCVATLSNASATGEVAFTWTLGGSPTTCGSGSDCMIESSGHSSILTATLSEQSYSVGQSLTLSCTAAISSTEDPAGCVANATVEHTDTITGEWCDMWCVHMYRLRGKVHELICIILQPQSGPFLWILSYSCNCKLVMADGFLPHYIRASVCTHATNLPLFGIIIVDVKIFWMASCSWKMFYLKKLYIEYLIFCNK